MNSKAIYFSLFLMFYSVLYAQTPLDSLQQLDEIILKANTILGNKFVAQNRTGASYYLSSQELDKFGNTDVNRALRQVPGVSLYEEDGFGLRPNLSLRGTSPQRSSKITLMEDGVLIAPAPYSAPAAYYFPSIGRMEAVEILKGSSQVQYGPFTTGGAINLVSTAIPETNKINIRSRYGSFNTHQIYLSAGQNKERLGYLLEYQKNASNGFKQLSNQTTGFDLFDLMGKIRYRSSSEAKLPYYLELKYHFYDEVSDETYLGLTEADFLNTPFKRYAASQKDQMKARQRQLMLTQVTDFMDQIKLITNIYQNRFTRNWYKLDDVVFRGEKEKLSSVLDNPLNLPFHMQILKGTLNSDSEGLLVKANNRAYSSYGVQSKFDYHWYDARNAFHDFEIGVRLHYDEEDRFQWEDGYQIIEGKMELTSEGEKGVEGNRISSAKALATYALYKYKWKGLTLTTGLRVEDITLMREDFGKNDPNRVGSNLLYRENAVQVVIPGFGFNYNLQRNFSLFGGVHKGFSPPGNTSGEQTEESVNYELGTRFSWGRLRGEGTGYYNDYSNLLGSDLAATGGTGTLDQFNAGEVAVSGLELLLNLDLAKSESVFKFPISFAYTLTNAVFKNNFESTEGIWGAVKDGDRVPYIPQHQSNITVSLVHSKFEIHLNFRTQSDFVVRTVTSSNEQIKSIGAHRLVDLSANYRINSKVRFTTQIINLLNSTYAASQLPSGYRPGHPFGIYSGLTVSF